MLFYHKCNDCLTAFSTVEKVVDFCDCNGSVTFMGEVQGDKYVKTENRSPCDGRCTHASGPHCDCMCGGVNHGTGKLVPVVIKEGKVCATNLSEEDVERAHVYRRFKAAAEEMFNKKYTSTLTKIAQQIWVDRAEYLACVRAQAQLEKICAMKVHNTRIQALMNFIVANKVNEDVQIG